MQQVSVTATPTLDHHTKACLALWATVMHDGIKSAAQAMKKGDDKHPDSRWFMSDEYYPGSFAWLCELFGYDVNKARSATRMKFRMPARAA